MISATRWTRVDSPIGPLLLTADDVGLSRLYMHLHRHGHGEADPAWIRDDSAFAPVRSQLAAYFDGDLREFDVALHPHGTAFQLEVWSALSTIPYGATRSYSQIAGQLGRRSAARAVGVANGRNPISIIVPCHRVIGAAGALTGYGGGLERKRFLLELERGGATRSLFPM